MAIYKEGSQSTSSKSSQIELPAKKNTARRYTPSEKQKILQLSASKSGHELKRIYGVSHETVRRWSMRDKSLSKDKQSVSSVPGSYSGTHPNWRKALEAWKSRPGLGPQQICNQLKREGIRINVATVRLILEENGYTPPKTTVKETQTRRYEAARPLELAHMDFKHFYINKQKVYLLLMQDDYSRFIMGHIMSESENIQAVTTLFESSINRYGKPQTMMTDGGSAFYSWNGVNKFQRLLSEEYGVDHLKAGSPRSNGKLESVNKQIEKELFIINKFSSLEQTDQAIEEWIDFYNFSRTHMGLPEGMVPADRFFYGWNKSPAALPNKAIVDHLKEVPSIGENGSIWIEILRIAVNKLK